MKRGIIKIDESKCNGCGNCIPNCHEGALQIIDDKAVLISDLMCDGLGACLGHCPEGALEIEQREAEPYDEIKVMAEMVSKGKNVVKAHLLHLKDHNEGGFLMQGIAYLKEHRHSIVFDTETVISEINGKPVKKALSQETPFTVLPHTSCPGSQTQSFTKPKKAPVSSNHSASMLTQWPIQLHLINPGAALFQASDLLVAADCVAFTLGNFHTAHLAGKKLVIACPKLDTNKDLYLEKLIRLINDARVNTITVMIMEVPCCNGLLQLVLKAKQSAARIIPIKALTISLQGKILADDWM